MPPSPGETPGMATARKVISPWLHLPATSASRRNQSFPTGFDSSLGYPGEGPPKRGLRVPLQAHQACVLGVRRKLVQSILSKRTQQDRRVQREGIRLGLAGLAPFTVKLYRKSFVALWDWMSREPPNFITDTAAYDQLLAGFIEAVWEHGETRAFAGNAISASLIVYPELKKKLHESWALLSIWSKVELPKRAPPLSPLMTVAIAEHFRQQSDYAGCFLVLLGFDAFLRTGELLNLALSDISFSQDGHTGVINLWHTKTGQKNAAFEALPIDDPLVFQAWCMLKLHLPRDLDPSHFVYQGQVQRFYDRFNAALKALNLHAHGFRPYSLRRGGATSHYRRLANLNATIERGRWGSIKVGRIYICDGLGKETELRIPMSAIRTLRTHSRQLVAFLRRVVVVFRERKVPVGF